jgi:hypothetical protein
MFEKILQTTLILILLVYTSLAAWVYIAGASQRNEWEKQNIKEGKTQWR